jgi:hypothetical protein
MTRSSANESGGVTEAKLPGRDWILLPMISLLTICILAGSTELIARRMFRVSNTGMRECLRPYDPWIGTLGVPNATCSEKRAESPIVVEYKFDSCGHRAGMECGPKPPGTYRIVLIGSSIAFGSGVPREMTFAALLPEELSQRTGRRVELYNEGLGFGSTPEIIAHNFDAVLSEDPDLILWILGPIDFMAPPPVAHGSGLPGAAKDGFMAAGGGEGRFAKVWRHLKEAIATRSLPLRVWNTWDDTRTSIMLQHLMYRDQSQYVNSYLKRGYTAGFLSADPSVQWQTNLRQFDMSAGDLEGRAKAAHIPMAVALVPNRAQAIMLSTGKWPNGYDPYEIGNELHQIIASHGGTPIDILSDFRGVPNPEQDYFLVDGHPNADGHAIIAEVLAKELTSGTIPALKALTPPQTVVEGHR